MPKQTFFNLPEEKREHILRVAIDEFADKGYKLASVSSIVARAGIAKGSFYQYFEDKDDLYEHIFDQKVAQRKRMAFEQEKQRLEDLSLTGFLRMVFHRQLREFGEQPQLMKMSLEIMQLVNEPIFQRIMGRYQHMTDTYFLPFIQHEVDQGEIDPNVNTYLLNFMLVSLGQYQMYLYNEQGAERLLLEVIDHLVDDLEYILTNGIYLHGGARHDSGT